MSIQAIIVLILIFTMLFLLSREFLRPGIILFSVLVVLLVFGIINTDDFVSGFSNKGMITVLILFFISEAVRQTGALNILVKIFLPKDREWLPVMLIKMMLPISLISSVLNNTPVVIIFAPMIKKWADKLRIPASKFLIPLSYATIFGGVCTLIGTSTNLVVHGLMLDNGYEGFTMFELGKIGIFIVIFGTAYMAFIGPMLLPGKRKSKDNYEVEVKQYYYNVFIPEKSPFIGKNVTYGHFPDNRNIFVTLIERNGETIDASKGETMLQAHDKVVVLGGEHILEQLVTLNGVDIEDYENIESWFKDKDLVTVEVVVSDSFPALDQTLKEFNFFQHYRGMVAAINRNGEKITTHTGDVKLKPGDCLVVLATPNFIDRWKGRRDFYLVSKKGEIETPKAKPRIWISLGLIGLLVFGASFGEYLPKINGNTIDMFLLAGVVAVIMFFSKLISAKNYTSAVSWDVILTIACSFGISKAVQNSGLDDSIATNLINPVKEMGPVVVLGMVCLITAVFTEFITNNAAVALMFPIAMAVAQQLNVNAEPFFVGICISASASFSTPIGYQTNLIVQGIGEYRFKDFIKVGIPLNILVLILCVTIIPLLWPF